ncbi:MAG TPA: POTRA domain-containing protein, partial [Chlamydiales bacterium]|nr:POTRA domain-containing protein [Chlamydiales bacterium]
MQSKQSSSKSKFCFLTLLIPHSFWMGFVFLWALFPLWGSEIADISLCNWSIDENIDDRVLIESTRAIVLVDFNEKILNKEALENLSGLVIIGDLQVPGSNKRLAAQLAPLYFHKPLTVAQIKAIKKRIQAFFVESNYPFTTVTVPCQSLSSGVLQLIVCQSKLSTVALEGTGYARTEPVKQLISVQPGERIQTSSIQRDLAFINRNPYRRANAIYTAGKEPCTTDLIIPVEERKPWRVYGGADNQGIPTIRRQRIFTGVGFNMHLGCDHNFNFQYTTAYDPTTFQGYTAQWTLFLPWKNIFNVYGGYSAVQAITSFPETSNRGIFIQTSGRYTIPDLIGLRYPIEFTVGFDFKRTNTTLLFSELFTNTSNIVNLSQFVFDARWSYEGDISRVELVGEIYYSPGALLGDETGAQYNGLRPGATPQYVYGKGALRYTQWLPSDVELILWMRGQLASA